MSNIFFCIIISLVVTGLTEAAAEVSHPPTFEQMQKELKEQDPLDMDLYEALQYTSDDIQRLKSTDNLNYIIAAASQLHGEEEISLLMEHLRDVEKNILGLSLLIATLLDGDELRDTPLLEDLIQKLKDLSPNIG